MVTNEWNKKMKEIRDLANKVHDTIRIGERTTGYSSSARKPIIMQVLNKLGIKGDIDRDTFIAIKHCCKALRYTTDLDGLRKNYFEFLTYSDKYFEYWLGYGKIKKFLDNSTEKLTIKQFLISQQVEETKKVLDALIDVLTDNV